MKKITRTFSGILAAALLLTSLPLDVKAAKAGVSVDEAVYVNLDYYGKTENMSLVKSCSLNGNSTFTDYGSYDNVTNMSNEIKPSVSDGSVSWKLTGNDERFYYECKPKSGTVALPWSFDVSYKLNGTPINADKLAGVSGLVEINIKAVPNKKVNEYIKNNMVLTVETLVDMTDTTSVEAPGAQLQAVGNRKAVVFAGLPGEENNYTIRIGTKKFESTGIIMTMMPGTLDQLTDVKDLKKSKDTIEDSADGVYDSINEILKNIQSTSSGLGQLKSGLSTLDGTRSKISSSKNGVYSDADKSLADMVTITKQINDLIPHLQNSEQMVNDINSDVNTLVDTINSTKPYVDSFTEEIDKIQKDIDALCSNLEEVKGYSEERKKIRSELMADIHKAETDIDALESGMYNLSRMSIKVSNDLDTLTSTMGVMPQQLDGISALYGNQTVAILNGELKSIIAAFEPLTKDTSYVISATSLIAEKMGTVCADGHDILTLSDRTVTLVDDYFDSLDKGIDSTENILKQINNIGSTTKGVLRDTSKIIDNASALNVTMNKYKDGTVNTLKDTETLLQGLTAGVTDTHVFLTSFEALIKSSGAGLDDGTRESLNGLVDLLQKSLNGIGTTKTVKNANDTIKHTYDDKVNKIEDDSNLLNLDAEAKPISFTSSKNAAPQSIQVIMRTKEISIDNDKNIKDLESSKEDAGFISRVGNVIEELGKKIADLFADIKSQFA